MSNKEPEIVEFMTQSKISILGITDIRKKGTGTREIDSNFVLIWSGVSKEQRAEHGVGFIIHPDKAKELVSMEFISERLIKIGIREGKQTINYIQVYAPCNDSYSDEEKDSFFEQLSDLISSIPDREDLYVMGDFNGRVGKRRTPWTKHLGPHSDHRTPCNYNGNHVLELCAEHDLIATNTFFQHRASQIYTWYKWNDNVSSQIDFMLARSRMRSNITDSRAIPNAGLDTDHRPVITTLVTQKKKKPTNRKRQPERLNTHKLGDEEVQTRIRRTLSEKLDTINSTSLTVEEAWDTFKTALLDTMKEVCGTKKTGGRNRKATAWWNGEVKDAIREKKRLYKIWVKSKKEEDYIKYRLARRHSKKVVKTSKENSWTQYGEKLSETCKTSPREFYKSVKAMRVRDEPFDPTTVINDTNGEALHEEEEILKRWEDYFKDLLNPSGVQAQDTQCRFTPSYPDHSEPTILESEVRKAVKTSPKNKAAGDDGITTEAILACGETGIQWLTTIFQKAWEERKVPEDWQNAIVVPIWKKKGSKKDCSTYRGISLLSHAGKMYAKILEQRTRAKTEHLLSDAQFGFRKGRGCTDAIFALRQLCERAMEYNQDLHLVFVDQEKAFDRVNRDKLWKVLEQYDVKGQLLDNIRAIYANSRSAVRTASGTSDWFPVTSGVRQGCNLSPLLFVIYMDQITKEANPDPEALNELLFADDQAMMNNDKAQLQEHTDQLNASCEKYDMKISISKTEVMTVSRRPDKLDININGSQLKQASEFKYLGSIFTENGKLDREIETRCQKANAVSYQLAPLLKHPNIPMSTKAKLINTIFLPTLTYQCQTWSLTKALERKLVTCEMKCLRRAVNKTRRDKIRNEVIRDMVGATPVLQHMEHQKIKWFGHLTRMPPNQPALRAYNTRYSGWRARGRPRRRWSDSVADTLRAHEMSLLQATRLAADRRLYLPATPTGTSGRKK